MVSNESRNADVQAAKHPNWLEISIAESVNINWLLNKGLDKGALREVEVVRYIPVKICISLTQLGLFVDLFAEVIPLFPLPLFHSRVGAVRAIGRGDGALLLVT